MSDMPEQDLLPEEEEDTRLYGSGVPAVWYLPVGWSRQMPLPLTKGLGEGLKACSTYRSGFCECRPPRRAGGLPASRWSFLSPPRPLLWVIPAHLLPHELLQAVLARLFRLEREAELEVGDGLLFRRLREGGRRHDVRPFGPGSLSGQRVEGQHY